MNKQVAMGILLLVLGPVGTAVAANPQAAMQAKPDEKRTFAMVLDHGVSQIESEVVPAAEAMPEDKFNFAPAPTLGEFKGVRTFAQQIKHIAAANYLFAAGILAEKPPVDLEGENGPAKITSKADAVQFLKDSFTYLHKAVNTIDENNVLGLVPSPFGGSNKVSRLGLATAAISHPLDHYGQMVEYLRMNNIIPPASRPQK